MLFKLVRGVLLGLIVLSYPLFIYYLLSHDLPWFGALLVISILIWRIRTNPNRLWWISTILIAMALIGYFLGPAVISKAIPVLIHLTLFTVFWSSLKTTPLITAFAQLDFPELPDGIADYCRSLTIVWAGFFAFNILLGLWLAFAKDDKFWAIYNGLIVYLLLVVLIVGEYLWRRVKFPDLEVPSFSQSVENIIKKGPGIWNRSDK